MGCWNHTCLISNLHVRYGQDVAVFLLVKNRYNDNSFCYGNALYNVMPLPFYGKYNDYGAVEDCHGNGLPYILEALKEKLYKFGQGPNSCHDIEVNKDNFDIEMLFEADHEGRLGIDDPARWSQDEYDLRELEGLRDKSGLSDSQQYELDRLAAKIKKQDGFRQVTHVVIHGDIFRSILNKWYIEDYVGGGKGNTGYGNNYVHLYFKDLVGSIPEYINRKKEAARMRREEAEKMAATLATDKGAYMKMYKLLRYTEDGDYNDPCLAMRWMSQFKSTSAGNVWDLIYVDEIVENLVESEKWEELTKFVTEVLIACWINNFMAYTRKLWVKQCGSGSQNSEPLGYEVLANAVLDVLKEERRESGEDDE